MRLQKQLTLSHLLVTIISVVILLVGLLAGYWLYLKSYLAAAWTSDWAEIYADEYSELLASGCENAACLETFIAEEFLPVFDMAAFDEWLIVIDADGTILGSNNPAFAPGASVWERPPFGITTADFMPEGTTFGNLEQRHFALAPMPSGGWIYYHGGSADTAFQLQQTARTLLYTSVALGVIALLVSGIVGGWLGRFFAQKLTAVGSVSAAFAAGNLTERAPVRGNDEITVLASQFNQMADTIEQQIGTLRELAETNARLAEEAEGLARLEERNRLARELHDAVKQQLFGLNLTLGSIPSLLPDKLQLAQERLQQVMAQTQTIQVELDQIIRQMRPASLQDQGLALAVKRLAAQWSQQTGVSTAVDSQHERDLPLPIEQTMYRIVQEALQNVGKHAQATQVTIHLLYDLEQITLHLRDDGLGFDVQKESKPESYGLRNMQQRVAALEGTIQIKSTSGGTQITVNLPTSLSSAVAARNEG